MELKRGDILLADLEPIVGSEQGKTRPVLVIQNDISNKYSPLTIILPITSKTYSKEYPTNVQITTQESGLPLESTIMANQIRTVDKSRIIKKLTHLNEFAMNRVNKAIKTSLALD